MAKPRSPRGEARKRQPVIRSNEDSSGSSEDEDSFSHQNSNRNNTPRNTSGTGYLNVSSRSGLSNRSDLNSSAETHRHTSRLNTSTSSEADSPQKAPATGAPKPSKLYPELKEIEECSKPIDRYKLTDSYKPIDRYKLTDSYKLIDSSQEVSSNKTSVILAVCAFFVILAALAGWILVPANESTEPVGSPVSLFHRFTGNISNLAQVLPNQNKRLWRTVMASAKHVLNDTESDYPVVILMASPTRHAQISKCIAKKIAENFELSLGLVPVESVADIGLMQHLDPGSQKKKLDDVLHSAFSSKQRKAFVIDNLQLLHPQAALMLHGYCDNDNAPYKDVMMVLLLYIDQHEVSDYSNASVEDYLEQLWSRGLEVDKVKALLSRVANNIVTVEMEDEETFSRVCS